MSSRLSAGQRLVPGFVAFVLSTITLSAFAGKPAPPPPTPPPAPPGITTRVSVAADGTQGNNSSYDLVMTPDARYVAFVATATNLVPGAQHYYTHVYLHDRVTHTTERISVASDGTPANHFSYTPAVSADGRYVAFESYASNLVVGDGNGQMDVFVRDRATGSTERTSVAADGTQGNARSGQARISADGRYVVFLSDASNLVAADTNAATDIFLYDRLTRTPERVSLGAGGAQSNSHSYGSAMSADARWVAFSSEASNLVSADTNGFNDVFLRDRATGVTERVSVSSSGAQGNWDSYASSVSADGNVVAFVSYASNLVAGDGNPYGDVFVRIRSNATTERVNLSSSGVEANDENAFSFSAVSADGRFVAFDSYASNLVAGDTNGVEDVFVRERLNSP